MNAFLLHNIGPRVNSNYNTLQELLKVPARKILTFDGVYEAVWEHRYALARMGNPIILFPAGDHVGRDNSFDAGQPPAKFATWKQIQEIVDVTGAEVGWHSWSHRRLDWLKDDEIRKELHWPREQGFKIRTFAYPYGNVDKRVENLVKEAGYESAWCAGHLGDGSQFQLKRQYLNW